MSEDTQKVVINAKHGGFGLSDEAAEWLIEERDWTVTHFEDGNYADPDADLVDVNKNQDRDYPSGDTYRIVGRRDDPELRADPDLVEVIERDDIDASGRHAELRVVEVPADVDWTIEEYDGAEWVAETHRTWR